MEYAITAVTGYLVGLCLVLAILVVRRVRVGAFSGFHN